MAAVEEKGKEREREKIVPPTPPQIIHDRTRGVFYTRVGFLGEGGFARVYEVQDRHGQRKAVKVVSKAAVRTKKNKTKLWAEIKLHQMLNHPNIVHFEDCFEDDENVYMILELCENGSLMDLLRRRKRYSEPEARFFLVQLIAACQYMHSTNVIHRDLKLGNLFLDGDMNIKVGDLGLAALIENPGDRKKTICGTPNYIAPEVLFDTVNGHSFEVDIWSVGVILYTFLIGKPPFQTKDVKAIYKRIRENRYEFPPEKDISPAAQDLIMSILNPNPANRPTLSAILQHPFFSDGPFPPRIPAAANDFPPDFRHLTMAQSQKNFEDLCRRSKVGGMAVVMSDQARLRPFGPSIMQQEKDFRDAVQPDSPISALLKSARQPLVQAPTGISETNLLRRLTAAGAHSTLSPVRRLVAKAPSGMDRVGEEEEPEDEAGGHGLGIREREVATQKARIVSEMAISGSGGIPHPRASPRKPLAPSTTLLQAQSSRATNTGHAVKGAAQKGDKVSLYETVEKNLSRALVMAATDAGFTTPQIPSDPPAPKVFVVSWLDYCGKYGMGFAMNDGTIAVHFNDSSSLALAPNKKYFDHISPSSDGLTAMRANYPVDGHPRDLANKVYLLKSFEGYMLKRLYGEHSYAFEDLDLTRGMVYVTRYLRMKHVILFRLSNEVLQFNFYDHTKLIFSQGGLVLSVIDRHDVLRTWSLESLLGPTDHLTPKDKRRVEGVLHKVQYARDVLSKIQSHGADPKHSQENPDKYQTEYEPRHQAPDNDTKPTTRERVMKPIR
ncbi:PLK/PLK1 protein kinase [Tremella mesenterica]|uniref:PLK/PLK1 protein kinase n=1 Tax=Tremella mesenterica TaxID=5217 RepID=A0A4Q1B8J8_TREME|nr:PLK/PLK1 protein kinase [Tremella mesenterica]